MRNRFLHHPSFTEESLLESLVEDKKPYFHCHRHFFHIFFSFFALLITNTHIGNLSTQQSQKKKKNPVKNLFTGILFYFFKLYRHGHMVDRNILR